MAQSAFCGGGFAQACGAADEFFIKHPSLASRAFEGLVIKASTNKASKCLIDCAEIKMFRRPSILGFSFQPIDQFNLRGRKVGNLSSLLAHRDKRIGFFSARRHQPTRTVIFETAAKHHFIGGKQC